MNKELTMVEKDAELTAKINMLTEERDKHRIRLKKLEEDRLYIHAVRCHIPETYKARMDALTLQIGD